MNISLQWLNDYLPLDQSVEEICKILTSTGLEVGGYEPFESIKGGMKGLVVGKVLTCAMHPDSDHLHVTTVDTGGAEPLNIICGAPNVAAGQKVIVATIGTVLTKGDESFEIKKSKIRGLPSEGMICAEDEIGIGEDHEGIMVLPEDTPVGMAAADYFHLYRDTTIEIDITPNRADGASHLGAVRDLTAYLRKTNPDVHYTLPSVEAFRPDRTNGKMEVILERPEACRRYAGLCIEGVQVKPSPEWLQNRLRAIGQHPINNIVDITNYILFGIGQPLHSFNMDKIKGNKVIVKSFPAGTKFVTLDGVERSLDENDLMICNSCEPMCMAGVFGGLDSGITNDTVNVFLESACFDPVFVRKTARRHGLNTDASFRYERGTDPRIVPYALKLAALMVKELAGGEITTDIIDIYPTPVDDFHVEVTYEGINRLIGKGLPAETIKSILTSLDIQIASERPDGLSLLVPPYRVDVTREADIVEEVLRIYGFNNIELSGKLMSTLTPAEKPDHCHTRNLVADLLVSNGFTEVMNNSLTKASYFEGLKSYNPAESVQLLNPLSTDLNVMRQTLLFGGLEDIAYNLNRQQDSVKIFEFGKHYKFFAKEGVDPVSQYKEEEFLSLFISGTHGISNWRTPEQKSDFFYMKSYAEMVLRRLGIDVDRLKVEPTERDIFSEGLDYVLGQKCIMSIGKVAKAVLKKVDVAQPVFFAEIAWEVVFNTLKSRKITYVPMPKFPAVKRDLALLLDRNISFKDVRDLAFRTEKSLLKEVTLFDVYEGEKLGQNKKSYAVSFTLLDENQTLTDKQIEKTMSRLIGAYTHQMGAVIR